LNIFVYGTLKKGCRADFLLKYSNYIGNISTKPFYRLYTNGTYPCMKKDEIGKSIEGELYSVSINTLKHLSSYEGVDDGLFSLSVLDIDLTSLSNNEKIVDSDLCLGYLYLGDISRMKEIPYWREFKTYEDAENRI